MSYKRQVPAPPISASLTEVRAAFHADALWATLFHAHDTCSLGSWVRWHRQLRARHYAIIQVFRDVRLASPVCQQANVFRADGRLWAPRRTVSRQQYCLIDLIQ